VSDKGSPNPQGFWRVGVGVGVRDRNFLPSKNPYLVEGMEGMNMTIKYMDLRSNHD